MECNSYECQLCRPTDCICAVNTWFDFQGYYLKLVTKCDSSESWKLLELKKNMTKEEINRDMNEFDEEEILYRYMN